MTAAYFLGRRFLCAVMAIITNLMRPIITKSNSALKILNAKRGEAQFTLVIVNHTVY